MQRKATKLSAQVKRKMRKEKHQSPEDAKPAVLSTGSTLVDLAISGTTYKHGGLQVGNVIEIYGPSSCGKTGILCDIAGRVQREHGDALFLDPETRLQASYADLFGLNIDPDNYKQPITIREMFDYVHAFKPRDVAKINAVFGDSLAALTTEEELEDKDAYAMRRAKEFSIQLRKIGAILKKNNALLICSNQARVNVGATQYQKKLKATGGMGIEYYASVILECSAAEKLKRKKKLHGHEIQQVVGIRTMITVAKNSTDVAYRTAPVTFMYNYGIDDIRENLQYIKDNTAAKVYTLDDQELHVSLDRAISIVEADNLEKKLQVEVRKLWHEIDSLFHVERKAKR